MSRRHQFENHHKWDEWSDWNECYVTCGNGTASRVRACYDWEGNISKECDGMGVEVQTCAMQKCMTGTPVVQETTDGECPDSSGPVLRLSLLVYSSP